MALKTLRFVQGLSRTPLLFIPRYLTTIFFKNISQNQNTLDHKKSENLELPKRTFTNRCPGKSWETSTKDRTFCFDQRSRTIDLKRGLGVWKRTGRTIRILFLEVSPDLVTGAVQILDFQDFHHFWKVTSSQNTSKLVLGFPRS